MIKIRSILKRSLAVISIIVMTGVLPAPLVLAEEGTPPDTTTQTTETTPTDTTPVSDPAVTTPPSDPQTPPADNPAPAVQNIQGPQTPTGDASKTYTYNPNTGLYENDFYTWNPVTKQTQPKTKQTYSYNPATGFWDTTEWRYDAPSGKYVPNVVSTPVAPSGLLGSIDNTGPDSTNLINDNSGSNATFNLFYDASISNNLNSNAMSGDASVFGNTLGGSATSGDATAMTNIINMLQSSSNLSAGGDLVTFFANIDGNVVGDLMVDPGAIAATQGAAGANTFNQNLNVQSSTNAAINNNINLNAGTGDATVAHNTTGGNATTGNANAVANIVNLLNSLIGSGQSFMGMININGNLDGDILLPQNMLDSLIGSNANSLASTCGCVVPTNTTINNNNNLGINNNTNLDATSGSADVSHNTTGGNATTGNALTNLTLLNLTGSQVIGKNAILVFINVLGKWVGVIMDAPAGSTAAAIGGGLSQNTLAGNTNIDNNNNLAINNNLNLNANSGNAGVNDNTTGGNATSGNATASANLANIINSQMSLSDWFGVLFINVFGTWNGSFGVDTAAGNKPATSSVGGAAPFKFVAGGVPAKQKVTIANTGPGSYNSVKTNNDKTAIFGSDKDGTGTNQAAAGTTSYEKKQSNGSLLTIVAVIVAVSLLGADRFIAFKSNRKAALGAADSAELSNIDAITLSGPQTQP